MIEQIFKQLQDLQDQLKQLPSEQQATLTTNVEHLSSSLQELAIEFNALLFPNESIAKLERLNNNLEIKLRQQAARIRQLEEQSEQKSKQYRSVTQALTKGEARLQTFLRNSSDLITIVDANGRIREQSPVAVKRILGYKIEERIGEFQEDLLHPDDVKPWRVYFAKLLEQPGIGRPIEYRKLHADGYWVYLEVVANNLLHDSSINGIVINSRDITERKISEAALAKSQQQIVNILENITDGFYTLNRQWQFTYVNPKAEECLQKKRQELLGKNIWTEFPDTANTIFFKQFHKALCENVTVKFEGYNPQLNIWFQVEAYPSEEGLSVFFQNITDRKITEDAIQIIYTQLEQQTKLLNSVLSTTPDKLLMFDSSQRLTYINRAGLELTQLSETSIFGKNLEEIGFPHELIELYSNCWEKILATGQTVTAETEFINPRTGHQNYCSYIFTPILSAEGNIEAILVTSRDITELKTTEAALRESESRYRILSQITSDFGYSFNVLPDKTWACEWMTEAFNRITGYTSEEIETLGWPECDCIHPDDREMLVEQMESRISSQKEVSEYRIITKAGEIRWLWDCRQVVWSESEGRAVRIYGVCQDITEHKLVEAKLCETNQVLQGLIEALPLPVVGIDANALVTLWNPAAERFFGWNKSEVLGEILPIVPKDKNTDFSLMFQSELAGELQVARECQRQRKDGSLIDVCVWTAPIRDADGQIAGSMRILSDILEGKAIQENTSRLQCRSDRSEPFWYPYVRLPGITKK
jgi:PAS domain S-box-containing protein